ncbi:Zn(II)2Cys6 transcription factor domain-containing protein [Aspergillus stella-maris]|uniref:Zn(II)2Cys6 transcription factor domain-containing protein n=1 Tax=Aspergillus stella-maris TaxID=1810926 RepID=UPI003CCDCEF0
MVVKPPRMVLPPVRTFCVVAFRDRASYTYPAMSCSPKIPFYGRRYTTRSTTGCLTCRRRRLKCDGMLDNTPMFCTSLEDSFWRVQKQNLSALDAPMEPSNAPTLVASDGQRKARSRGIIGVAGFRHGGSWCMNRGQNSSI